MFGQKPFYNIRLNINLAVSHRFGKAELRIGKQRGVGPAHKKSLLAPWNMGRKGFRVATQIANCLTIYRFETYDKGYGPVTFITRSESGLLRNLPTARTDRRFSLHRTFRLNFHHCMRLLYLFFV